MANEYYDHTTYPSNGAPGSSAALRAELDAIEAAFNKLPTLSGNGGKILAVNSGGTALEAITTTGTGNGVRATAPTFSGTVTMSGVVVCSGAGSVVAPQVSFNGATMNWIGWSNTGTGAPAFTTRSAGTKLALWPQISGTEVDYGFGIEVGALWTSVPTAASGFKWYAGTTEVGALTGAGVWSGNGLKFPATQVASADVNTLDDYEEQNWTPNVLFGGANTGLTYNNRQGGYTKIGNAVHFRCYVQLSAKGSSTGSFTLSGLPFAAAAGANLNTAVTVWFSGVSITGTAQGFIGQGASSVTFHVYNGAAFAAMNDANFTATTEVMVSGVYFV